ncbi:MAG: DUF3857 domain-containing protein [Dysgonamonadaceae bacterium]|jgi:hypothetical protein|nr:DUF3857 domain-containing protein [Dysgonamonadaceae bacterium]
MKKLFFLIASLSVWNCLPGQNYPVSAIPENLKIDARAVVRESSESFVQQDEKNGIYKNTYVITILSEKGKSFSDFAVGEDDFYELKKFSGEVYDATGKTIKKIGKKDLTFTGVSANLAANSKTTFYRYSAPAYPYTVKYEYEMTFKNGILVFPAFDPIPNHHVALEKAEYSVQIPSGTTIRYKAQGVIIEPEQTANTYTWKLSALPAVPYEKYAPTLELFPVVYIAPSFFCVENACGNMDTWESYGEWQAHLLKGRNILPQKTIDKVRELTQNAVTKQEKAKILYEYLQQTTHYVSIQLGLGGWQPMKAETVAQTGFGDCKALSNYMKALLETVDIPSYYTIISTNKERFFPDFPSFQQANHVILMIPFEQDTVYLECTSQDAPFGYISRLAGHDALAVGNERSFFHTLPACRLHDNAKINRIQIRLDNDATGHLEVHSSLKNEDFEKLFFRLKGASAKEESDALAGLLRVHKPQLGHIRKEVKMEKKPQIDVSFTIDCEDFATQTGSRMLVSINPARSSLKELLTGSDRRFDILMKSSHYQQDTVTIRIPEGYSVETRPKVMEVESPYGYFKSEMEEKDGQIVYSQTLEIKKGRFAATEFDEMKKFYNRMETLQNGQIGFKKN